MLPFHRDKSSLDYILADASQGPRAAAGYMRTLHQCVAPGGVVCIVSFHPHKFLEPFFAGGWLVIERADEVVIAPQPEQPPVTVLLARRPLDGPSPPPARALEARISEAIETWHTSDDPLLTDDERDRIRAEWVKATGV